MGSVWGGSIGKVGALELVGGYKDVARCIKGIEFNTEVKTVLRRWGGWRDLELRRCMRYGCRDLKTSYNPEVLCLCLGLQ